MLEINSNLPLRELNEGRWHQLHHVLRLVAVENQQMIPVSIVAIFASFARTVVSLTR